MLRKQPCQRQDLTGQAESKDLPLQRALLLKKGLSHAKQDSSTSLGMTVVVRFGMTEVVRFGMTTPLVILSGAPALLNAAKAALSKTGFNRASGVEGYSFTKGITS